MSADVPNLPTEVRAAGLTLQQATAVELRGSSVHLSSGAGCGKTHVLTARYLSHIKNDSSSVGQLVAITFTERAAREMRERIRGSFRKERDQSSIEHRTFWEDRLEELESALINTIHSFCGNLLRQYPAEMGIDPQFEILDEVLSLNVRWEAIREELQSLLLEESDAGNSLRALTQLFGWYKIQNSVLHLIEELDQGAWSDFLNLSEAEYRARIASLKIRLLKGYCRFLLTSDPTSVKYLTILLKSRYEGNLLPVKVREAIEQLEALSSASNLQQAYEELHKTLLGPKEIIAQLVDPEEAENVKEALKGFRDSLKNKLDAFLENESGEWSFNDFEVAQQFVRVALAVNDGYSRRKKDRAVLDFNDLLVMARDLLKNHPDVREELAQKYSFILLDELQDTDPTQMELVRLICDTGLKYGKLFAVGDAKQSIYRFRGADVFLFNELRNEMPEPGRLDLSTNFRSQKPILDFVNTLFRKVFDSYVPLEAFDRPVLEYPNVEFLWSFPEVEAASEKVSVEETRQAEGRLIARRISELLQSQEERIWDSKTRTFRPVRAGDVTILFRSMSNVQLYEEALRYYGIDYYLIGGRAFFAQQEIYDVLNVLRIVENANDSIALAGLLRSPMAGLNDQSLFLLRQSSGDLWDCLFSESLPSLPPDQMEALQTIRTFLKHWSNIKDHVSIHDLLVRIIEDTGYDAALQFEFLGDRKLANLWKLVELARRFDQAGFFTLTDFIERLAELVENEPKEEQAATQPENADVVKLMTIHQSKGLEFPVVIIADYNRKKSSPVGQQVKWQRDFGCVSSPPQDEDPLPFSDQNWRLAAIADRMEDDQEELRVLYVACTRPRDLLILSAGFNKFNQERNPYVHMAKLDPNSWLLKLGQKFDIRTGEILQLVPEDSPISIRVISETDKGIAQAPYEKSRKIPGKLPDMSRYKPLDNLL